MGRKECNQRYYTKNKGKLADWQRFRKYSITREEYEVMLEKQGMACAICGFSDTTEPRVFPVVDHDHSTGVVRGILCSRCNVGLGKFLDNPDSLDKAAAYLREQDN